MEYKRRTLGLLACILSFILLFGACAPKAPDKEVTPEDQAVVKDGPAKEESAFKDRLVWGQGADVTSLDPHIGKETPAVTVTSHIFDTLTTLNQKGEVEGQIAESWKQVNEKEYHFTIRDGILFHNGAALTVEDVKFSLDRAINSKYVAYIVNFIDKVEIVDENTVSVQTKAPYAPILRNLAVPFAAIVPKAYVEEVGDTEFALNPIGSGPYQFVSWQQGAHAKLTAFDDYYAGAPLTKNLEMRVIPEAAQRTIALETGEVDISYDIQANDVRRVEDDKGLELVEANGYTCWYLSFNTTKAPFDDKRVRKAIRHAIDVDTIIQSLVYGAGDLAGDLVAPGVFGHAGSTPYSYDIDQAKELLKEAGLEEGFECTLWVNDNQSRVEICQAIADMLKQINVRCSVEIMEFGSFIERTSQGEHEMAYFGWTTSTADADYSYYSLIHSSQHGAPGNRSFIANDEADKQIEIGRSTEEVDKRKAAYAALEVVLQEEFPNAPLYYGRINAGVSQKVQGFALDPNGYHQLDKVTIKK